MQESPVVSAVDFRLEVEGDRVAGESGDRPVVDGLRHVLLVVRRACSATQPPRGPLSQKASGDPAAELRREGRTVGLPVPAAVRAAPDRSVREVVHAGRHAVRRRRQLEHRPSRALVWNGAFRVSETGNTLDRESITVLPVQLKWKPGTKGSVPSPRTSSKVRAASVERYMLQLPSCARGAQPGAGPDGGLRPPPSGVQGQGQGGPRPSAYALDPPGTVSFWQAHRPYPPRVRQGDRPPRG